MLTKLRAQTIAAPRKTLVSVKVEPSGDFAIREDEMVNHLRQGEDRSWGGGPLNRSLEPLSQIAHY